VVALKREKFKFKEVRAAARQRQRRQGAEVLKELARTDDVMQKRSLHRDRENPFGSSHFKVRANDWAPIRAKHYGQRPHRPHKQAGHLTTSDQYCSNVRKFLPRRRPHMDPWQKSIKPHSC